MIPLALTLLRRVNWRVWAGVAGALLVWWQVHAYGSRQYAAGVAKTELSWQAKVSAARQERIAAYEQQIADTRAANDKTASDSAQLSGQLQSAEKAYTALLDRIPTKPLVIHETKPGVTCPDVRLSGDFRLRINEAVTGTSPAR